MKVPVWGLGSGKFFTPCERMHSANFSTAWVYDTLGEPLLLAPDRSPRQDCMAERNCEEFGSIPFGITSSTPFDDVETAESGKFLTPLERMQAAKANPLDWAEPAALANVVVVRGTGP